MAIKYNLLFILSILFFTSCSTPRPTSSIHHERSLASIGDQTCNELVANLIRAQKNPNARDTFYSKLNAQINPKSKGNVISILGWAKSIFTPNKVERLRENFDALLFIDYKDTVASLMHLNLKNISIDDLAIKNQYDIDAFKNFDNAFKYLKKERPPFTMDTLKTLHKILMNHGIDDIAPHNVGKFRRVDIYGNIPRQYAITEKEFQEIASNNYLSTAGLKKDNNGKYFGYIGYPSLTNLKPEILSLLVQKYPDLWKKIGLYNSSRVGNAEELTSQMVNALTEDLLSWFVKQKDDIGDITSPEDFRKFVNLIAEFQKKLISIHPFADGNGRTVREFAVYYSFWEKGFLPPRIIDPDSDIYTSTEEWMEMLIKGSINSQQLYESMAKRLDLGLPIESTPELFLPYVTDKLKISLKSQKPANITEDAREIPVDTSEAVEFFILKLQDKKTAANFALSAKNVYDDILADFEKYYVRSNLDYVHEKNGLEHLGIHFADNDFRFLFGKSVSHDIGKWEYKMKRWYSSNEIIWRGLSRRDYEIEQDEIISMFTKVHPQFVSNRLAGKINSQTGQEQIIKMANEDFLNYNQGLLNGDLEKMAKDHSETGPRYGQSYGYSTSKKREVGKAFAMGAMVVAEYGKHKEFQHLLKSRVLVGMKRSDKDVDLSRLKQLRPDFSYKYPRQQEVMGVGAADPDSVTFVQLIDAEGGVLKSYVRNPKNPQQVLVFDKEISDVENIPDSYIELIELN